MFLKLQEISFSFRTVLYSVLVVGFLVFFKYVVRRKKLYTQIPSIKHAYLDLKGDLRNLPKVTGSKSAFSYYTSILQLLSAYTQLFRKLNCFCLWISYTPMIVFVKAKAVEELIGGTKMMEKSWPYDWLHPWLGRGLLTSYGSKWKSRRKLLTPSFHFDILKDFLPVFDEQSQILVQNLKTEADKPWIDIIMPATLCTLDVICETTLGVSVSAQKNSDSEYVQAVLRTSQAIMDRMFHPQYFFDWIFFSSEVGRRFKKDLKLLHDFTISVIHEKKKKLLEGNEEIVRRKRKALMDLLLEHHIQTKTLTEEDIREEVDTFAFEGHDTTAMGVSWSLYMIGLHKDVQDNVHEELDKIFGDDVERPITTDDLKEMKYLENVLKESQRLYPSVPMFGRQPQEETIINGVKVPKGVACIVFTYGLHRDPEVFPNPEKFDPDRFLPENSLNRHPFAYIPFSAGPRNCIGQRFAMMEEKVIVANVLRNFTLESLEERDLLAPAPELILRSAKPLKIKFRQRTFSS